MSCMVGGFSAARWAAFFLFGAEGGRECLNLANPTLYSGTGKIGLQIGLHI